MEMNLSFEDGELVITPENNNDAIEIEKLTGGFDKEEDSHGYRESIKQYGYSVYLYDDNLSVAFRIKESWWNHD